MNRISILYQDSDYVVCYKPAGYCSESDPLYGMVNELEKICGSKIFPVHRLDRQTSGVMVYAKNQKTAAHFSAQIRKGNFQKEYLAVLCGALPEQEGELIDYLYQDKKLAKAFVVKERSGAKKAVLRYSTLDVIEKNGKIYTAIHVTLITGRTHQIRAQFSSRSHPVLGDRKYGGEKWENAKGIALYAVRLTFPTPKGEKKVFFLPSCGEELEKILDFHKISSFFA